jgi:hypothetical protein
MNNRNFFVAMKPKNADFGVKMDETNARSIRENSRIGAAFGACSRTSGEGVFVVLHQLQVC